MVLVLSGLAEVEKAINPIGKKLMLKSIRKA